MRRISGLGRILTFARGGWLAGGVWFGAFRGQHGPVQHGCGLRTRHLLSREEVRGSCQSAVVRGNRLHGQLRARNDRLRRPLLLPRRGLRRVDRAMKAMAWLWGRPGMRDRSLRCGVDIKQTGGGKR